MGGGEGVAEISGDCSGMGEWGVGGSSAGGAGGCVAGGAEVALRPAEVPRRATHEVSITLTPMLGDTETGVSTRPAGGHRQQPLVTPPGSLRTPLPQGNCWE